MAKPNILDVLTERAEESASFNLEGNMAYHSLFGIPAQQQIVCDIPIEKIKDFFTAEIGFRPYTDDELATLAESIDENGMYEEIIVRPIPYTDEFEIMAGMHRAKAHKLLNKTTVRCKVLTVSDSQAVLIATETNLKRRQNINPIEKGFAYRAQVDALKQQGKKIVLPSDEQSFLSGRKITSRDRVALINGIDKNEIQRYIRLTFLINLFHQPIIEGKLPVNSGVKLSFYDEATQEAIHYLCFEERLRPLDLQTVTTLRLKCPAPTVSEEDLRREMTTLNTPKHEETISFKFPRRVFGPYLDRLGQDQEWESMLLEFLQAKFGVLE